MRYRVINVAFVISACSAALTDMYISSRALYSLASIGNAPRFFGKTTSWGLPWSSTLVAIAWGLLAFVSVGDTSGGVVFGWLSSTCKLIGTGERSNICHGGLTFMNIDMCATSGLLTWVGILFTYLRWDKGIRAQKIDRSMFPYRARLVRSFIKSFFYHWQLSM